MPDISDVGPPAKGPGLPERIPDAKPPPVKVKIEHGRECKEQEALKDDILKEIPEAQVELVVGADGEIRDNLQTINFYPNSDWPFQIVMRLRLMAS